MALTEAQKQRIKEEEAYRTSLKSSREQEKKKGIGCLPALLIVLFVIPVLFYGIYSSITPPLSGQSGNSPTVAPKPDLDGKVNFDGKQIRITNNENDVWQKCWFTINKDYNFPGNPGYEVTKDIQPGETFNINIDDFTKESAERFNPYEYRPEQLSASCDGRFGYWEW